MTNRFLHTAAAIAFLAVGVASNFAVAADAKDPVVIRVGDKEVKSSELNEVLKALPPQLREQKGTEFESLMRERLVDMLVLIEAAKAAKLDSRDDVKKAIAAATEQVLMQAYIADLVKEKITDAQIKERYEKAVKDFGKPEEIKTSHILVKDEAAAKDIYKQLQGGADFAKLAKEKSIDKGSADKSGELGFVRKEVVVEPFWKQLVDLKNGAYSQPFKTDFGWHIAKRFESRTVSPPTLDEAKNEIREALAAEIIAAKAKELRSKTKVEQFDSKGDPLKAEEKKPADAPKAAEKK